MFCKKCGNNLADNVTFCNRCGEKTGGGVNSNGNNIASNPITDFIAGNNNNSLVSKPGLNFKVLLPVMGGILVTVAIILVVFIAVSRGGSNAAKAEITETLNGYSDAMSDADLDYAVTFWVGGKRNAASSLTKIVNEIPYGSGILELLNMLGGFIDMSIRYDIDFSKDDITVDGNSASVPATVTFSIPGYMDISSQQTTFKLVKQDGQWLIDSARKGKTTSSQ